MHLLLFIITTVPKGISLSGNKDKLKVIGYFATR